MANGFYYNSGIIETTGSLSINGSINSKVNKSAGVGATVTADCSQANSFFYELTSASTAITLANFKDGQTIIISLTRSGITSTGVTWAATGGTIMWPSGTPYSTKTAGVDVITFVCVLNPITSTFNLYGTSLSNFS